MPILEINDTETFNTLKVSKIRKYHEKIEPLMKTRGFPGNLQYMIKETAKALLAAIAAADASIAGLDSELSESERAAAILAIENSTPTIVVYRVFTDQWPPSKTPQDMEDNSFIIKLRT